MSLDERGQVTAFVVAVVLALFVMGGLVIDGGYALATRRRAVDEANEAARRGPGRGCGCLPGAGGPAT